MADPSIVRFRAVVAAACEELESRRQEVNDLNVFPVADGDTGDNMAMTMRAVLQELDRINGQQLDDIGREELVHAVARAALLGARGNSGVILSQIVRGAAEELVARRGELVDPVLVAAAFARAADAAYESVRDPAEGTMLSAVRAMAHRVARDLANMEKVRLEQGAPPAEQDELLAEVLERALDAGKDAVERGPDQLPVLKEAGVVDAGAYGLTVIMAGVIASLRGDAQPRLEHQQVPARSLHLPRHESSAYAYCTNFAVTGHGLAASEFVPLLEEIGDCVLVVGDDETLRVHVHTDEPDMAVAVFVAHGEVSHFDVADMRAQVADRSARLAGNGVRPPAETACAVVAVVTGEGNRRLFEGLGPHVHVVEGGPTFNPSTYDLLAGIHAASGREAIVLPNNPNVLLAAERAAEISEKPARVVPTRSMQAALAALLAFQPDSEAAENAEAVGQALAALRTGGVAVAGRDDPQGRFAQGDALGYAGEDLVAWGDPEPTLRATLAAVCDGCEIVTLISGDGAPLDRREVAACLPPDVELDFQEGGQPAWWWLLCAE